MLIPLYISIISYDNSHLPSYIYAVYPAMGFVTLGFSIVVFAQLAHIHIASTEILKSLCCNQLHADSTYQHGIQRGERNTFRAGAQDGLMRVSRNTAWRKHRGPHVVTVFGFRKRHVLCPMRPLRVDTLESGQYIQVGAGSKLVSEVFTYLVLLLRLRELRLSEL